MTNQAKLMSEERLNTLRLNHGPNHGWQNDCQVCALLFHIAALDSQLAALRGPVGEGGGDLVALLQSEAAELEMAPSGMQSLGKFHATNWADKPHRVLYDAVALIKKSAAALAQSQTEIENLRKQLEGRK